MIAFGLIVFVLLVGMSAAFVAKRSGGGELVEEPPACSLEVSAPDLKLSGSAAPSVERHTEPGFAAMQLLGDTHLELENLGSLAGAGNVRARMVELESALEQAGCPLGLRRDIVEHLDVAASTLEVRAAAIIEGNVEVVDAISRVGDDLCRRSPVLVGRLGAWIAEADESRELAA